MKFTAPALAMAGLARAQLQFTNPSYNIAVNEPFNLTWSGATDKVDIVLKSGDSGNLQTEGTLDSGEANSYYVWTPTSDLSSCKEYAFEVVQGTVNNYSPQFTVSGLAESDCSSTSSSSGTATATSSSTSGSSTESGSTTSSAASSITGVSNSTTTSASSTGFSSTAKTSPAPTSQETSPISNTNAGQRASYSSAVLLLAAAAGMLFL